MTRIYFVILIFTFNKLTSQIDNIQNITQYTFQYFPQLINKSEFINGKTRRITLPGTYFLKEEIGFNTIEDGQDIISIEASNVTFILNDKTLFSSQNHINTTAIRVKSGVSNVIIQRGAINQINGTGIVVENGCTNIAIRDALITNCNRGGLDAEKCKNCIFSNIYISQCNNNNPLLNVYGIKLSQAENCNLKSIAIKSVTNNYKDAYGIHIEQSKSISLEDCESSIIEGIKAFGYCTVQCLSGTFSQCFANNIISTTGNAYGFFFKENLNIDQIECGTEYILSQQKDAYGFYLYRAQFKNLERCVAKNCSANNGGNTFGFYSINGRSNIFNACTSTVNVAGSHSNSISVGMMFAGSETHSTIKNSELSSNSGGNGIGYGIKIDDTAISCTIENNRISVNTGATNGYGIFDANPKSKNLYLGNFAYRNGKLDGSTLNNFDVYPAPSGNIDDFPVEQIYFTSYLNIENDAGLIRKNIELIEAQ